MTASTDTFKVIETIDDRVGGYNFLPTLIESCSRRKQCPLYLVNSESSILGCAGNDRCIKGWSRGAMQPSHHKPIDSARVGTGQSRRRGRVRCQSLFIAGERRRCEPGSNSVIVTNTLTSVEGHVLRLGGVLRTRKIFVGCPAIRPFWDQSPGIRNPRLETVGNRLYPLHDQDCLRRFTAEAQIQDRSRKSTGLNTAPGFLRVYNIPSPSMGEGQGEGDTADAPAHSHVIPARPVIPAEAGTQRKTKHADTPPSRSPRERRQGPSDRAGEATERGMPTYHKHATPPHIQHNMSTVFYRKWRPTRFSDVVGQQHVTDTLRRAVLSDRVAHAYLFTGPRGVGKTSTARILAKALNAELDQHGDPLPDTPNAIAIDEGRYMDLIEIDAASNRGVGDIRDLRERVLLRPTLGKFKVYIIDEVHMLTTEAFNALLKTLEEPPPQVVMILATTEIHRVPATIISRCQRFDFRRLTPDDVIGRLILICDEEEIECEPAVLELVARSAWGSLRDAENLLEQLAVAYGAGEITEQQARELLGIGDTSSARNLASSILRKDAKRSLEIIEEEASRGAELRGLRDSTISALRGALLAKHGIASIYGELGDAPDLEPEAMNASTEQMLHAITIFGRNERFGEASSPLALEIAALQAVAEPPKPEPTAAATPQPVRQQTRQPAQRQTRPIATAPAQRAPQERPPQTERQTEPATSQPAPADASGSSRILEEIGKAAGTQVRTTFATVNFIGPNNGVLIIQPKYASAEKRLRDTWMNQEIRTKLRPAFQSVYGNDVRVQLQQAPSPNAPAPTTNNPNNNPSPAPARTPAHSPVIPAGPAPYPDTGAGTQRKTKHAETRPAPAPAQFSAPPSNQLSDQPQAFNTEDAITTHPAVQNLRNIGGRVVAIEDD